MYYIFISLSVFILTVFFHILIHRYLASRNVITFRTVLVFPLGSLIAMYIVLIFHAQFVGTTNSIWFSYAPVSTIIVNVLATLLYIMLFASFFLEGESPSGKILFMIRRGPLRPSRILQKFTDTSIIGRRLELLVTSGLVEKNHSFYRLTPKGKLLIKFLTVYRNILRWDFGG